MSLSIQHVDADVVLCVLCEADHWRTKTLWQAWAEAGDVDIAFVQTHITGKRITSDFIGFESSGIPSDMIMNAEFVMYEYAHLSYQNASHYLFMRDSMVPGMSFNASPLSSQPTSSRFPFKAAQTQQLITEANVAKAPDWFSGNLVYGLSPRLLTRPDTVLLGSSPETHVEDVIDILTNYQIDGEQIIPIEQIAVPVILKDQADRPKPVNSILVMNPREDYIHSDDEQITDFTNFITTTSVQFGQYAFLYEVSHFSDTAMSGILASMLENGLINDPIARIHEREEYEEEKEALRESHQDLIDVSDGINNFITSFEENRNQAVMVAWGWILFYVEQTHNYSVVMEKADLVVSLAILAHWIYGLHPFKKEDQQAAQVWIQVTIEKADSFLTSMIGSQQNILPNFSYWKFLQFQAKPDLSLDDFNLIPMFEDTTIEQKPPIISVIGIISKPPVFRYRIKEVGRGEQIPVEMIKLSMNSRQELYFEFNRQHAMPVPASVITEIEIPPVDLNIVATCLNKVPAELKAKPENFPSILIDRLNPSTVNA